METKIQLFEKSMLLTQKRELRNQDQKNSINYLLDKKQVQKKENLQIAIKDQKNILQKNCFLPERQKEENDFQAHILIPIIKIQENTSVGLLSLEHQQKPKKLLCFLQESLRREGKWREFLCPVEDMNCKLMTSTQLARKYWPRHSHRHPVWEFNPIRKYEYFQLILQEIGSAEIEYRERCTKSPQGKYFREVGISKLGVLKVWSLEE